MDLAAPPDPVGVIREVATTTARIRPDDACLAWLRERHVGKLATAERVDGLVNDLSACATHRWAQQSFPSAPHAALSPSYSPLSRNRTAATVVDYATMGGGAGIAVVLHDVHDVVARRPTDAALLRNETVVPLPFTQDYVVRSPKASSSIVSEPSRHLFTELIRRDRYVATASDASGSITLLRRPVLGGYVFRPGARTSSVAAGRTRFVVFPQQQLLHPMHAVHHVPLSVRGTVEARSQTLMVRGGPRRVGRVTAPREPLGSTSPITAGSQPDAAAEVHPTHEVGPSMTVVVSAALPARAGTAAPAFDGLWPVARALCRVGDAVLFGAADGVELQLHHRLRDTRRRPVDSDGGGGSTATVAATTIEKVLLTRSGGKVTLQLHDPCCAVALQAERTTVGGPSRSGKASPDSTTITENAAVATGDCSDRVTTVALSHTYDSALKRLHVDPLAIVRRAWRRSTWRAQAGPDAAPWPIPLTYRRQMELVCGMDWSTAGASRTLFGKVHGEGFVEMPLWNRLLVRLRNETAVLQPWSATRGPDGDAHRYFWAVHGLQWQSGKVRGLEDLHGDVNNAKSWFSLCSLELQLLRRAKAAHAKGAVPRTRDGVDASLSSTTHVPAALPSVKPVGTMLFANACLSDSMARPPRASVGFSISPGAVSTTVTAFNALIPSQMECSLSWFLSAGGKLVGIVPDSHHQPQPSFRVSVHEAFHHMKCGATWKF